MATQNLLVEATGRAHALALNWPSRASANASMLHRLSKLWPRPGQQFGPARAVMPTKLCVCINSLRDEPQAGLCGMHHRRTAGCTRSLTNFAHESGGGHEDPTTNCQSAGILCTTSVRPHTNRGGAASATAIASASCDRGS